MRNAIVIRADNPRERRTRWRRTLLSGFALFCAPALSATSAEGQLRPYEPAPWRLFDDDHRLELALGAATLSEQRASLAGESGRLSELGILTFAIRSGSVVISAGGTVRRIFVSDHSFAPSHGGAAADPDGRRADSGDYRIDTTVRLTAADRPALAVLRFGTRLPTTDNRVGLERDRTDFYALVGGRLDHGPLRLTAETGVGIHGTREASFEQSDVLVYLVGIEAARAPLAPALLLLGHADGLRDRAIRGNEELAEARLRVRSAGRVWLQAEGIVGFTSFSPGWGFALAIGTTR